MSEPRDDDNYSNVTHTKPQQSLFDASESNVSNTNSFAEIFKRHHQMSEMGDDKASKRSMPQKRLGFKNVSKRQSNNLSISAQGAHDYTINKIPQTLKTSGTETNQKERRSESPIKTGTHKFAMKSLIKNKNETTVLKGLSEKKSYLVPNSKNLLPHKNLKHKLKEVVGGKLRESKFIRNSREVKLKTKQSQKKVSYTGRGKSTEKKVKQLLPHVKKKNLRQANVHKVDFTPYNFQSYKEKFGEKYASLGGLGPNLESHEWKQAMQKKRRMNMISKSIDFMNKKKYAAFSNDESLKSTVKETKDELMQSITNLNVIS